MSRWTWVKRSIVPMGAVLALVASWARHSSRGEVPEAATGSSRAISQGTHQPRALPSSLTPPEAAPAGPAPLAPVPLAAQESSSAKSLDRMKIRRLVEDNLVECRFALVHHDRGVGEKAYRNLLKHRDLAIACTGAFLKEAKDPSDRLAAEWTISLLSLPPTHGLLKHFEW